MPLLSVLRLLFTLLSLVLLGLATYLLWSWSQGETVTDPEGTLRRVREEWRLWTGLALLAWSLGGGGFLLKPLLARSDRGQPSRPIRGEGTIVPGEDGAELYIETQGRAGAPTIVLTHGWSLDSTIWNYAVRDLSKRFRVIVWDLPGLGRSKAGNGEVTLPGFARQLAAVLQTAEGPVVLVGHSIGGMIIQALAQQRPGLFGKEVVGVVLVNTTYTNPLKTMIMPRLMLALRWPVLEPAMRLAIWLQPLAWLAAWQSFLSGSAHLATRFGFGRDVTRSELNHTTLLTTRNPPGQIAKGNLAMFRWDGTGALAGLPVPVLVLTGNLDIVTKEEASEAIAASTPTARLQRVEGVNHMGFLERADVYNAAIATFVDSTQPTGIVSPVSQPLPSGAPRLAGA